MKKLSTLLLTFLSIATFAQHEADNWYFGLNAGLNFAGGSPVVLQDGAMNTSGGCATISDASGNLLFYTDGMSVWNKTHQVMPNGTGLLGGSVSQSAVIVPLPGSSTLYYVFTTDTVNSLFGFGYSVVDMSLDGGNGDVTTKNTPIYTNAPHKIAAVEQAGGNGYWITVHDFGTDSFFTYSLLPSGLQSSPIVSNVGIVYEDSIIQDAYGQLKFSPCGNKLAAAVGYQDLVQVFQFDNVSGIISNAIDIPMPDHVYGVEFSKSGQKLYVSTYALATLYQFDLSSGDDSTINASKTALSIAGDTYGLQLAGDGKIYVSKSFSPWLGAITDPEVAGPSCTYVDTAVFLDSMFLNHVAGLGMPDFVQSFFYDNVACTGVGISDVSNDSPVLYPNPSSTEFTFKLDGDKDIIIFDIDGKIVERFNSSAGEISFGKNLKTGIYFVSIKTNDHISTLKIVKM